MAQNRPTIAMDVSTRTSPTVIGRLGLTLTRCRVERIRGLEHEIRSPPRQALLRHEIVVHGQWVSGTEGQGRREQTSGTTQE